MAESQSTIGTVAPPARNRPGHPRRTYSDADRAAALVVLQTNGGNMRRTSAETGVPYRTLLSWRDGQGANPHSASARAVAALRAQKAGDLSASYDEAAWLAVDRAIEMLPRASARDAMVCAGIATEKMLLLRNQPTVIHGNSHPVLSQLTDAQFRELYEQVMMRAEKEGQLVTVASAGDSTLSPASMNNGDVSPPVDSTVATDGLVSPIGDGAPDPHAV